MLLLSFSIVIIVIINIIIVIIIIKFYVVTICFVFDGAMLWWGLEVWQIFGDVKNKRNGGSHEVDENDDNTFIYIYMYIFYLFIYLIIYLFIYLFIISFKLLKLRWIYSVKREPFR